MKIKESPATPEGVQYSDAPQGSPEWQKTRYGRIGASELAKWMAVGKNGKPLSSRKYLEQEKAFEKAFKVSFNRFTTDAMREGTEREPYVREQYELQTGNKVELAGVFYDDYSAASPDGLIGDDGGLEIKWLYDSNFMEVATTNEPLPEHVYQVQGNLRLSGRKWWDYVAANGNTGRFIIIRVERDEEMIAAIDKSVKEVTEIKPLDTDNTFEFTTPQDKDTKEETWK